MPSTRSALGELPTMTCSASPRRSFSSCGRAAAQINAVGPEEREHAAADVADERGLQRGGAERVDAQHLERIAPAGQCHIQFEHGTRRAHGGVARQPGKQLLGETFARSAHDDIRFAHQPFRGQAEFIERGVVDQIDRRAQRHSQGDRHDGDQQPQRRFPQLRQQQHAPNRECAGGSAPDAHPAGPRA